MSMFLSTQLVLQENQGKWSGIPAFVQANADFDAGITALRAATTTQIKDLRGYTVDKQNSQERMWSLTMKVSGGVMAWAEVEGNQGLAQEMNVVQSEFAIYRDAVLAERCTGVHDVALANLANLVDYGVTAADTTALKAAIDAYIALLALPRMLVNVRKSVTSEIGLLIRDNMRLLSRRMDRLMRRFELSDPAFFRTYMNARIIIDQGSGKAPVVVAA